MRRWLERSGMTCAKLVILTVVMKMKDSRELLSSILKTAQMGQVGIRSALSTAMRPTLRKALESQLQEYDAIESEAHAIASQRGWELQDLRPAIRCMTDLTTRVRLSRGNTDSKIAGMMIQGNTRGMITGLKNLHQFNRQDTRIQLLSQKLLDSETANIRQMQGFL